MREDLINTAVHFLQNQKVQSSPLQQRLNFLEKKGLNHEEINEALKRSGVTERNNFAIMNTNQNSTVSRWEKTGQVMSTILIFGGAVYFASYFFKKYIAPWFGWGRRRPSLNETLLAIVASNERMLGEIQMMITKLTELQRQINDNHSAQLAQALMPERADTVLELKNEIKSVKALLLRKDQFPLPPVVNPVIPSWQLEKRSTDVEVVDGKIQTNSYKSKYNSIATNPDCKSGTDVNSIENNNEVVTAKPVTDSSGYNAAINSVDLIDKRMSITPTGGEGSRDTDNVVLSVIKNGGNNFGKNVLNADSNLIDIKLKDY